MAAIIAGGTPRILGIGRLICHTRCMWVWFPTREKPAILTCSEPSERGVESGELWSVRGVSWLDPDAAVRLFPPKSKFGPDCLNGVAVQHLARASKNDRFLDLNMVGIESSETRCLGKQKLCFFYSQPARFNPG